MAVKPTTEQRPVVTGYATEETLFATRYKQGGRVVYSVALTPDQIVNLIQRPDPEEVSPGNRRIRPKHAQDFGRYFVEHADWISPGIILRAPGVFKFQSTEAVEGAEFGVLSYPKRAQGDIQILDGQHRILGFHLALKSIDDAADKARSVRAAAMHTEGKGSTAVRDADKRIADVERWRDRFYGDRVVVEIHVTDDLQEYRQMFFDIAENALGITASVKARFDTRKVVNRALPAVLDHPLLKGRTDLEVDRLSQKSPYFLSARHVMETVRTITVGLEGRVSKKLDKELKEGHVAANANAFFDLLVESFPPLKAMLSGQIMPDDLRKTSLLGSPLFIRILAGVYHELKSDKHAWTNSAVADYFAKLAKHVSAPVNGNSIFVLHAPEGAVDVGASAPNGRRQDSRGLMNAMVDWALDREPFVDADPLPAPEPEAQPEDDGLSDGERAAFDELEQFDKAHKK